MFGGMLSEMMLSSTRVRHCQVRYADGECVLIRTSGETWRGMCLGQNQHTGSVRVMYLSTEEYETVPCSWVSKLPQNVGVHNENISEAEALAWARESSRRPVGGNVGVAANDCAGGFVGGSEGGPESDTDASDCAGGFVGGSDGGPEGDTAARDCPGGVVGGSEGANTGGVDVIDSKKTFVQRSKQSSRKRGVRSRSAAKARKAEKRVKTIRERGCEQTRDWPIKEFEVHKLPGAEVKIGAFVSPYKDSWGNPLDEVDCSDWAVWTAPAGEVHIYYDPELDGESKIVAIIIGEGVWSHTQMKRGVAYGNLRAMDKYVKTEMRDKRSIPGRGIVRHFGVRHRNEEPSNSGKDKMDVVAKDDDVTGEQHQSWSANMSFLAKAIVDSVRVVEPDLVNNLENLMSNTVESMPQKACNAYPAGSCAKNGGYGIHFDPSDATFGTLAGFGRDGAWMALPEYRARARMNDGDVLVLNSGEVAHANVSHPNPPPDFQRSTISLYWNKKQVGFMRAWKRLQGEDAKRASDPPGECAHAFWADAQLMMLADHTGDVASTVPSHCLLGLKSATKHFKRVIVWTYGCIVGELAEISALEFRDASTLLPFHKAQLLLRNGASIAHVSDFVRILAANGMCGWIIDCDNIWIKNPPSQLDHAFATLASYEAGGYAKPPAFWKKHD